MAAPDLNLPTRRIKRILTSFREIRMAYLYGSSLVRNDFRDIDIAAGLSREKRRKVDSIKLRIHISIALEHAFRSPKEFDVHLLHEMPLSLQYRVISTGKCIFFRNADERIFYETGVLNQFLDFKPTHEWLVGQTLERTSRLPAAGAARRP